jgi:carbamoyl-phosphate synthase small subunit
MGKAILALADGTVFEGLAFGAPGEAVGEVVFNTGMTGYQEVLTDQSYKGQIVTMTHPHIGNTGVNLEDVESQVPAVEGFVVREGCAVPSNWRATAPLEDYLRKHGVVGIQGIDTRALTRHIRDRGAQQGVLSTLEEDPERLVAKAQAAPGLVGRDLVQEVTCAEPYAWAQGAWAWGHGYGEGGGAGPIPEARSEAKAQLDLFRVPAPPRDGSPYRVVVFDCGVKRNILRQLVAVGCDPMVVPAATTAQDALAMDPDGVLVSNGPGDPEGVPYLTEAVQALLGRCPLFGICLGHQILALALGGRTFKLKFGHRGANHPVRDLLTGRVEITTQNHGFAVDLGGFAGAGGSAGDLTLTHVSLNDGTCEGLAHRRLPAFSVQYHPEASPGPHDAHHLFRRFADLMERERASRRPLRIRFQEA